MENTKGEWGPGQGEINIRYADALTMADRHVFLKNGIKEIAYGFGQAITFMAKWRTDLAGSSCHIHQSLVDASTKLWWMWQELPAKSVRHLAMKVIAWPKP